MKYIYSFLLSFMCFALAAQTPIAGGNVQGNWTLAGSPYQIQGVITVPYGQTLTIQPGVEVVFQGLYHLYVNGMLDAEGTANQPIVFRAQDTTGWYNDAMPQGGWRGIHFYYAPPNDSSQLKYCHIQDTKHGVQGNASIAAALEGYRALHVSYCKIFHNQSTQNQSNGVIVGVYTFAAGEVFEIDHCELYDNYARVATLRTDNYIAGSSHIHHNSVHNNIGGCAVWALWCYLLLEENDIFENEGTIDGSAVKLSVSRRSKIFRNKIHHNTCETIGAVHCSAGKVDIDANLICNNQHISGFCGATDGGGGIHVAHNDNAPFDSTFYVIRNNVVANNYSSLAGGGVYVYNARVKIMNNHFINNTSVGGGTGMMRSIGAQSELDFQNNVFYGNAFPSPSTQEIQIFEAAYLRFSYNWIESPRSQRMTISLAVATYGDTANNVIGINPMLIAPTLSNLLADDATIANFNLAANSPCINAGNSDTTGCYVTPKDFLNNARLVARIDIGAFEHKGAEGLFEFEGRNASLHIFPNPAQNNISLILPEKDGNMTLYNMMGEKVLETKAASTKMSWELPVLPAGMYLVIWEKNGKYVGDKLVIGE